MPRCSTKSSCAELEIFLGAGRDFLTGDRQSVRTGEGRSLPTSNCSHLKTSHCCYKYKYKIHIQIQIFSYLHISSALSALLLSSAQCYAKHSAREVMHSVWQPCCPMTKGNHCGVKILQPAIRHMLCNVLVFPLPRHGRQYFV